MAGRRRSERAGPEAGDAATGDLPRASAGMGSIRDQLVPCSSFTSWNANCTLRFKSPVTKFHPPQAQSQNATASGRRMKRRGRRPRFLPRFMYGHPPTAEGASPARRILKTSRVRQLRPVRWSSDASCGPRTGRRACGPGTGRRQLPTHARVVRRHAHPMNRRNLDSYPPPGAAPGLRQRRATFCPSTARRGLLGGRP